MKICSVIVLISNKTQPDRNASIYNLKVNQQTCIAQKKKNIENKQTFYTKFLKNVIFQWE